MILGSLLKQCNDGLLSLFGNTKRVQEQQDRAVVTLNTTTLPPEAETAKALKRLARSQQLMAKVSISLSTEHLFKHLTAVLWQGT
jgi:hypothetical protein